MRHADFERLYDEHAQRLYGFLVYRTGDPMLAEDVLADAFEAAYRARARFDARRGSGRTWLYTIALNRLRDVQRRAGSEAAALTREAAGLSEAAVDAALEHVEARDDLSRALAVLSPDEREAIALRFGADLSLKEIAAVLSVPVTTVEARVYRALRRLRDALDGYS